MKCLNCNKLLKDKRSKRCRSCSMKGVLHPQFGEHTRQIKTICNYCEKTFVVFQSAKTYNRGKYCSRNCASKSSRREVYIQCKVCEKMFLCKLFLVKKGSKYCSQICSHKDPIRRAKISQTNKKLQIQPSRTSLIEKKRLQAINEKIKGKPQLEFRGENSPNWKGGMPKCLYCKVQLKSYIAKTCLNCFFLYRAKEAWHKKPNKPEKLVEQFLNQKFPQEWKFVGNGEIWIGRKNPDFININGQKKLIEVYGDYWHKDDNPQDRIDHFKKYGFNTLVLWEKDIFNSSFIEKIQTFLVC